MEFPSISEWLSLLVFVLCCPALMIFNGVRQKLTSPSQQSAKPPQGRKRNPGLKGFDQKNEPDADSGLTFNPRQYTFNLDHMKKLKWNELRKYKSVYFHLNMSESGHAVLKRPSVLSSLNQDSLKTLSTCFNVLNNYNLAVDGLRKALSKDGKVFHDPLHPVFMHFEFWSNREKFSTSFLIYHANSYAYGFIAGSKWRTFCDSPYRLIWNNQEAPSIRLNSRYPDEFSNFVGVPTLIEAIKNLNKKTGDDLQNVWKNACLHLVYCFIGAACFRDIENFVRDALRESFDGDPFSRKKEIPGYCRKLVNDWGTLCDALVRYELDGVFPLAGWLKELYQINEKDEVAKQVELVRFMVPLRLR